MCLAKGGHEAPDSHPVRRRKRTPWPKTSPTRVRTVRSISCLREDDGFHPRCPCGWYGVAGSPTMDEAVALYDLHQMLQHAKEPSRV